MSTDKAPASGAKKKPAKKKKEAPRIEKILAKYQFTPPEMAELGGESGRLTNEINALKEEAKSAAAEYKSRLDHKEAARNTVCGKLANGYEMRETECVVTFKPKEGKKFYHNKRTKELVREDQMTHADFQLPMFTKKEEEKMKKPADPKKSNAKAGKTNVGDKVTAAIIEAASKQPKVEFNVDSAQSEFPVPAKFVNAFKTQAKKAGWEANTLKNLAKLAVAKHEEGIGAVAEVLRPFAIND